MSATVDRDRAARPAGRSPSRYGRATRASRARRRRPGDRRRRARRAVGPLGLGQDDAAARARRAVDADPPGGALAGPLARLARRRRPRPRRAPRGIAYVFQGANLLPNFTAYENVAFAAPRAASAGRATPRSCSRSSASAASSTRCPASCPAARPSGWRSPGRSRSSPSCCCATSPPATSIRTPASARARPDRRAAGALRLRARDRDPRRRRRRAVRTGWSRSWTAAWSEVPSDEGRRPLASAGPACAAARQDRDADRSCSPPPSPCSAGCCCSSATRCAR